MIHIVLLSGGSGSRLWPLSNSARSKQFLKVLRDDRGNHISMVQRVFAQLMRVDAEIDLTIATCANQEVSIRQQIAEGAYSLVLEPERRDTAPAIMLACAHLDLEQDASLDDTVIVMPIDTFADQGYYNGVVKLDSAIQDNLADLTLLGVRPTYPSEKYGYIIPEKEDGEAYLVSEFKEKPNEKVACELIAQGGLWNCGVFAFKLGYLRNLTKQYLDCVDFGDMLDRYGELPRNSFDYEVVEKCKSVAVVPYSGTWKDLGTWNTLCEEMSDESAGRVVTSENSNVHVINETGLPVVVSGLEDAVVVATHDGILACSKHASARIKQQVEAASETRPMYEKRKWGEYRVIDSHKFKSDVNALTKELVIFSGHQLSYQRHAHRSEVWTVAAGRGEVVLDGRVTPVVPGTVIDIRPMQMHAVRAFDDLHVIEVQLGSPLIEEDIERFGNYWNSEEMTQGR